MSIMTRTDVIHWVQQHGDDEWFSEVIAWVNEAGDTALAHRREVERLRARIEALEAIAREALVDNDPLGPDDDAGHWVSCDVGPCESQMAVRDRPYVHAPNCPVTRARALLTGEQQEE